MLGSALTATMVSANSGETFSNDSTRLQYSLRVELRRLRLAARRREEGRRGEGKGEWRGKEGRSGVEGRVEGRRGEEIGKGRTGGERGEGRRGGNRGREE